MSDILDGFMQGMLIAVAVFEFMVILALYLGIPKLVMDILDEYMPGSKRSSGKRTVEGMAGLTQNPLIRTAISALAPGPGSSSPNSNTAPGSASAGGYLKGLVRR